MANMDHLKHRKWGSLELEMGSSQKEGMQVGKTINVSVAVANARRETSPALSGCPVGVLVSQGFAWPS